MCAVLLSGLDRLGMEIVVGGYVRPSPSCPPLETQVPTPIHEHPALLSLLNFTTTHHPPHIQQVSRIKLFLPYMVRKRTFKKIMAHDEENACGMGDIVRIKPSRPLSKRKRFTLHEVLRRDPKLSLQQQAAGGGAGAGKEAAAVATASS